MQTQDDRSAEDWSRRPRPNPTSLTEPFWEGTRAGELRMQRCADCGEFRWTPQLACPACLSEDYAWEPTTGLGSVYSFTTIHRSVDPARFEAPYLLAIVALDAGPHLLTNLVDCAPEAARVGMRVKVRFTPIDDEFTVYPFAPIDAPA